MVILGPNVIQQGICTNGVIWTYGIVKLVPASIDSVFGVSNVMPTYKSQNVISQSSQKTMIN
jgi:hypothetical protein